MKNQAEIVSWEGIGPYFAPVLNLVDVPHAVHPTPLWAQWPALQSCIKE